MTEASVPALLRRAARKGATAWSVADTQPWRFELLSDHVDLLVDPARRLEALDASGRMLAASLGAALYDLRVALAASGRRVVVERLPEPGHPELMARVRLDDVTDDDDEPDDDAASEGPLLDERPAEATAFTDGTVPQQVLAELVEAAQREDNQLLAIAPAQAGRLHELCQEARDIQLVDPACRAELRAWVGAAEREPDFPDLGTAPTVLVIGSARDDRLHWLRAGEALERVLLTAARHGLVASISACSMEVPSTRLALREELELPWFPHLVVRVGHGSAPPGRRRRRLVEVLFEPS